MKLSLAQPVTHYLRRLVAIGAVIGVGTGTADFRANQRISDVLMPWSISHTYAKNLKWAWIPLLLRVVGLTVPPSSVVSVL